jgi:hypothetical protein
MVAWARAAGGGATRGFKTGGAGALLSPARKMPSRGESGILRAHMAGRARLRRGAPASWPAGDGIGQREERGGRRCGT